MYSADCIREALGLGAINDLMVAYFQSYGATSNQYNVAEKEFLIIAGASEGTVADMWTEVLTNLGYTGSLMDMFKDFWCIGGGELQGFLMDVVNTQVVSGNFRTVSGETVTIHWGDGTTDDYTGTTDQAYSHDYGSVSSHTVTIDNKDSLTRFKVTTGIADLKLKDLPRNLVLASLTSTCTVSGSLKDLPSNLLYFYCYSNTNTVSGQLSDLPDSLLDLVCYGYNTISGLLGGLPSALKIFYCTGYNTISGVLSELPNTVTTFTCYGYNTIYGDIGDLSDSIIYFKVYGYNSISDYTAKTWTTIPGTFRVIPTSGGLSSSEVDQLLNDLNDDLTWSGGTITITGTNAARTSASDAAVANLESEGVTVTTN